MTQSLRVTLFALGIAASALLPLVARAVRGGRADRCALDGIVVSGPSRVRAIDADETPRRFCCIDCATDWIDRTHRVPREVSVVDETSGDEIDASRAWFVSSRVVAFAITGCRIHTFALEKDARAHAAAFNGEVLLGDARPFRGKQ